MTLRDFYERYGVTVAIAAIVALVLIILPGNPPEGTVSTSGDGIDQVTSDVAGGEGAISVDDAGAAAGTIDAGGAAVAATGGTGAAGRIAPGAAARQGAAGPAAATGGQQAASGGGVQLGKGPCRQDARMAGISKYLPPCLSFSGDNGGATARGVEKDKVKVVLFASQSNAATQAILEANSLADDRETVLRAFDALRMYSNNHFETYGREVVFEVYDASGPDTSDETMRADAKRIAEERKAFAVIGGPKVLGQELAARGVICICTVSLSSDFYKENPPYMFGSLPTSTEYAIHSAEYIGKKLKGKPAAFAGDEFSPGQTYKTTQRKFGMIYIEGSNGRVDPEGKRAHDAFVRELARYGVTLCDDCKASYLYDPGRNQQDMTTMIARLKAAGVTTVIMVVDPLTPAIITAEATRQSYFPEWFITGTGLSDTTTAARIYERNQWSHAFGISPLWVTWVDVKQSSGYREFHHGMPGRQPGDEGVLINIYRAPVEQLFMGIHMAGPKLTPETYVQGMFNYPRTGGTSAVPLIYMTREFPTQIKDFTEIWYAADERGKDERGQDGAGMIMKADGGARFEAGKWPVGETRAFIREGAIAVSDNPPGGGPLPHEQDGHKHEKKCISCA